MTWIEQSIRNEFGSGEYINTCIYWKKDKHLVVSISDPSRCKRSINNNYNYV